MPTEETLTLQFHGPFSFTDSDRSLFHCPHATETGVYLWTFRQPDGSHLVHYVGETKVFAQRQKEHLTHMLGLNYGLFDPDEAEDGRCKIVYPGRWRDKSADGPRCQLEAYRMHSQTVLEYISRIHVFFAPLQEETDWRKHIEGCIGWHIRYQDDASVLYPDDTHIGTKAEKTRGWLRVQTPEPIRGIEGPFPF